MMRKRLVLALAFCAAAMGMSAAATSLLAAPLSKAALSLSYAGSSSLTKARIWLRLGVLPARPVPGLGAAPAPSRRCILRTTMGPSISIRVDGAHYRRPAYDPWRWRERDGEDRRDYRPCYGDSCGYRRCDGDTCGESCGIVCWYRRVRNGYCGHGCEAYREQARDERDYPIAATKLYAIPRRRLSAIPRRRLYAMPRRRLSAMPRRRLCAPYPLQELAAPAL